MSNLHSTSLGPTPPAYPGRALTATASRRPPRPWARGTGRAPGCAGVAILGKVIGGGTELMLITRALGAADGPALFGVTSMAIVSVLAGASQLRQVWQEWWKESNAL
jgi:hypothetical protein